MRDQNREELTEQSLQAELDRMAAETPEMPESFRQGWREAVRAEAAKRAPEAAWREEAANGTGGERTEEERRDGKPAPKRILPWRRAMGTAAAAAILLGGILAGRDVAGLTRRAAAPAAGSSAMTIPEKVSSDAMNGLAPALVEESLRTEKAAAKEEARDQAAPEAAEETAAEMTAAEAVSMAAVEMTAEEAADMAVAAEEESADMAMTAAEEARIRLRRSRGNPTEKRRKPRRPEPGRRSSRTGMRRSCSRTGEQRRNRWKTGRGSGPESG